MMNAKRANPIIDRYVTTDVRLDAIIADLAQQAGPVEHALALICSCLDGRRLAKDALAAVRQVGLEGIDPELTVLLLCRWAELLCRLGRPTEADVLLSRTETLTGSGMHPVMIAESSHARAILADAKGRQGEHEAGLREAIEQIPESSPRRKFHLWELGLLLARQGRGVEFETAFKTLTWQCNDNFPADQLWLIPFLDAVETGRIRDASALLPRLATTSRPRLSLSGRRIHLADYQALLALMHTAIIHATPRDERVKPERPVWVQIPFYLLQQEQVEALKWARLEAKRSLQSIFGTGFPAFNLIRAELASGNGEAARRLMQLRANRGNQHFLDPFFHARGALLAGNRREAIRQLAKLRPDLDRYAAHGRLDFELLMVTERPADEIRELMRTAETRTVHIEEPASGEAAAPEPENDQRIASSNGLQAILGRSAAIQQVRETIKRLANLDAPVLITGETGTGKELIANALHMESKRREEPFIPVNCGAIPETLLESELFGYARGAFTGADQATGGLFVDAGHGTLLLDEIGEITPRLQTALLRVMETGEVRAVGSTQTRRVHCRVIAATNADLESRVEAGTFRRDLLYRLQRLCIHIPPLRERREDIMLLARRFLDEDRPVGTHTSVSRPFIETLRAYDWPGNVRELRNVLERMRLTHSDKTVYDENDLDLRPRRPSASSSPISLHSSPITHHPLPITDEASREPDRLALDHLIREGTSPLRRLDTLRELFSRYRRLTRAELVKALHISPNTATKYLKLLIAEGTIRRVEPSASTRSHYFEVTEDSP